jgi:curli biogenesis system outer membrane secretion channel CsgG
MSWVAAGGLLIMLGLCPACVPLMPAFSKDHIPQVVAVNSFENRSGFEGDSQWRIGTGMADLLVNELVASKCFVVVEREQFAKIVEEIERQRNAHFRPEGRTQDGRMKNAHYLIRGVINDFSQVGGAALGVLIRKILFLGRGYTARVSLTLTIVEVETGQIVDSVHCTGTALAGEIYAAGKYENVVFGGEAFFKTPLGNATRAAIRDGVKAIIRKMPRTSWQPMIVSVTGKEVIVNGGHNRGLRAGQQYVVRTPAQAVTDPATGDILDYLPGTKIGTLRLAKVDEKLAYAEIVEGTGFERGQWLEQLKRDELSNIK